MQLLTTGRGKAWKDVRLNGPVAGTRAPFSPRPLPLTSPTWHPAPALWPQEPVVHPGARTQPLHPQHASPWHTSIFFRGTRHSHPTDTTFLHAAFTLFPIMP